MRIRLVIPMVIPIGLLLSGCDAGCENEVVQIVASPSGALKVVSFHRGCGATTGFNTQVSVLRAAEQLPSGGGNALVIAGAVGLRLAWTSDSSVRISGLGRAQVFKQEEKVSQIEVAYAN